MKYARFEVIVLGFGAIIILASILFAASGPPITEEIIAQVLLFVVLASAVYGGRKAGFIAALLVSAAYLALRVPLVMADQGLSLDLAGMLTVRVLGYGVVGIVGGQACDHLRSMFSEYNECQGVDPWSKTCNQRFITRALDTALGEYQRYDMLFSAAIVNVSPDVLSNLSPARHRELVHTLAQHIKNDIRVVDEIGRLDDGSFLLVFPHTPSEGALAIADRLRRELPKVANIRTGSISIKTLSVPEDVNALQALCAQLAKSSKASAGNKLADRRP